jgi:hypothetical protein
MLAKLYDCTTFFKNGMKVVFELGVRWAAWTKAEASARLDTISLREIVSLFARIPFEVGGELGVCIYG